MKKIILIVTTMLVAQMFIVYAGDVRSIGIITDNTIEKITELPADDLFSSLRSMVFLKITGTVNADSDAQVSQVMDIASVQLQLGVVKQNQEIIKQNKEIIALLQKIADK